MSICIYLFFLHIVWTTGLQNIATEEAKSSGSRMLSIKDELHEVFRGAIEAAVPEVKDAPVAITPSTKENFGDYQCNSAMAISGVCTNVTLKRVV